MKQNRVHGTPEQFEAALKNKIQELKYKKCIKPFSAATDKNNV